MWGSFSSVSRDTGTTTANLRHSNPAPMFVGLCVLRTGDLTKRRSGKNHTKHFVNRAFSFFILFHVCHGITIQVCPVRSKQGRWIVGPAPGTRGWDHEWG